MPDRGYISILYLSMGLTGRSLPARWRLLCITKLLQREMSAAIDSVYILRRRNDADQAIQKKIADSAVSAWSAESMYMCYNDSGYEFKTNRVSPELLYSKCRVG